MPEHPTISTSDIIHSLKLSCQIPNVVQAIASQKIIVQAAQEAGIDVTEAETAARRRQTAVREKTRHS